MGGQDRTFRKFPQRSKSFQLKPTNAITSMKRFSSRLNSTSTSANHNRLQPNHKTQSNTKLILTKNDLIVQDSFGDLQSNDMTKSVQHEMFTLNLKDVMQPIRRYESMSDRASLNGIDQRTAHSATTLIINCSSMPPISPSPSSSSSSSSGYGEPLVCIFLSFFFIDIIVHLFVFNICFRSHLTFKTRVPLSYLCVLVKAINQFSILANIFPTFFWGDFVVIVDVS